MLTDLMQLSMASSSDLGNGGIQSYPFLSQIQTSSLVTASLILGIVGPTHWQRTIRARHPRQGRLWLRSSEARRSKTSMQTQRNGESRRGKPWRLLRMSKFGLASRVYRRART